MVEVVLPSRKGPRGYSAYEIALQNGFVGTEAEWLTSLADDAAAAVIADAFTARDEAQEAADSAALDRMEAGASEVAAIAAQAAAELAQAAAEAARDAAVGSLGFDAAAISVSGGGLVSGGGDLTASRTLTVTEASQAEAEAASAADVVLTPRRGAELLHALVGYGGEIAAKTGAYTAVAADFGKTVLYTGSGGVTLTLTAPGTVGNPWWLGIRNEASAAITVAPASGTIDGRSSLTVYPNEPGFIVVSDGTDFHTLGRAKRALVQTQLLSGVAAVDFEAVYADPEIASVDYELIGLKGPDSTGRIVTALLKFSGAYVTGASDYFYSGTSGGAASGGGATGIYIVGCNDSFPANGALKHLNPLSSTARTNALAGTVTSNGSPDNFFGGGLGATKSGNCQGLRFQLSANFGGGTIRAFINRG